MIDPALERPLIVNPIRRSAERDLAPAIFAAREPGNVCCSREVPRRLRGSG